jgi:hypothetical protein
VLNRELIQPLAKLFGDAARTPAGPAGTGVPAVSSNYFLHTSPAIGKSPGRSGGHIGKPTGTFKSKQFFEHGNLGQRIANAARAGIQPARPQLLPSPGQQSVPKQP